MSGGWAFSAKDVTQWAVFMHKLNRPVLSACAWSSALVLADRIVADTGATAATQ